MAPVGRAALFSEAKLRLEPPYSVKLPQPYNMLDKMLWELVEGALETAERRDADAAAARARAEGPPELLPATVCRDLGFVTAVRVAPDRQHIFVGNSEGQLIVVHAESGSVVARADVHAAPVGSLAIAYGTRGAPEAVLLASASAATLCVYEVDFNKGELTLLCSCDPPAMGAAGGATALTLGPEGDVLVAAGADGSLAAHGLPAPGTPIPPPLPPPPPPTGKEKDAQPEPPPPYYGGFKPLLLLSAAEARGLLEVADAAELPVASTHFQIWHVPRPPAPIATGGKLAVQARAAPTTAAAWQVRALYAAWPGQNKVLLLPLAGPLPAPAEGEPAPTLQPLAQWRLPHAVTCTAQTDDGALMAWGLASGSVVLWDPRLFTERHILPPRGAAGAVCAAAFVRGQRGAALIGYASGELAQYELAPSFVDAPPAAPIVSDALSAPARALLAPPLGGAVIVLRAGLRVQAYDGAARCTALQLGEGEGGLGFTEAGTRPPASMLPAPAAEPSATALGKDGKPVKEGKDGKDVKAAKGAKDVSPADAPPPEPVAPPPPPPPRGQVSGRVVCDYRNGLLVASLAELYEPPAAAADGSPAPPAPLLCGLALYDVDPALLMPAPLLRKPSMSAFSQVGEATPRREERAASPGSASRGGGGSATRRVAVRSPEPSPVERAQHVAATRIQAAARGRAARTERRRRASQHAQAMPEILKPSTKPAETEDAMLAVARRVLWLRGGRPQRVRRMGERHEHLLQQLLSAEEVETGDRPALAPPADRLGRTGRSLALSSAPGSR